MTNTTSSVSIASTTKVETRGRKFNPSKYAINRAWEISKNAAVAHNTNPLLVAQKGLVKPSEYFSEALVIGWKEAKAKGTKTPIDMYQLHTVPKKSLTKIIDALASFIVVNEIVTTSKNDSALAVISKAALVSEDFKLELATTIFDARYTTGAARSTNRHTLHALVSVSQTGEIPLDLQA